MSTSRFSYATIVMLVIPLLLGVSLLLAQNKQPEDSPMPQRTSDGWSYSPLRQINRDNVVHLRMVWSRDFEPEFRQRMPLVYDGIMYLYTSGGRMHAMDATTGNLHWDVDAATGNLHRDVDSHFPDDVGDPVENAGKIVTKVETGGGLVFGGDRDGWFHAFNNETGEDIWEFNLGAPIEHFPITYSVDGRQYVAVNTNVPFGDSYSKLSVFALPDSGSALPDSGSMECPLSTDYVLHRSLKLYSDNPRPYRFFPFILTDVEEIGVIERNSTVRICEAVHRSTWNARSLWLRIATESNPDPKWIEAGSYDDIETFLQGPVERGR